MRARTRFAVLQPGVAFAALLLSRYMSSLILPGVPAEHLGELLTDVRQSIRTLWKAKGIVLAVSLSTGLAVIGFFGLLLASVGLAGVTGYAVTQRTKEIGIRVALGASMLQVLRVVSGEGAFLVLGGVLIGEAGAMGLTGVLNAWFARLHEITRASSSDPLILIGTPALLTILAMVACYIPARRALRTAPVSALRQE